VAYAAIQNGSIVWIPEAGMTKSLAVSR